MIKILNIKNYKLFPKDIYKKQPFISYLQYHTNMLNILLLSAFIMKRADNESTTDTFPSSYAHCEFDSLIYYFYY